MNHPINSFKRFCKVIHEKFPHISIEKKFGAELNDFIAFIAAACSCYNRIFWMLIDLTQQISLKNAHNFMNISNKSSEWWRWDQNANWRYQYQNWHYFNHFFFEYIIEMTFLSGRLEVESDQPFVTINFYLLSATFMLGSEIFNLKFILESF